MGGSSGVLLSIFFTATGESLRSGARLPSALVAGLEKLKFYGGAAVGDRTMIDALEPALVALASGGLAAAEQAAREGSKATAEMKTAAAGRSAYVNAAVLNAVPDPGAIAVAEAFEAAADASAGATARLQSVDE